MRRAVAVGRGLAAGPSVQPSRAGQGEQADRRGVERERAPSGQPDRVAERLLDPAVGQRGQGERQQHQVDARQGRDRAVAGLEDDEQRPVPQVERERPVADRAQRGDAEHALRPGRDAGPARPGRRRPASRTIAVATTGTATNSARDWVVLSKVVTARAMPTRPVVVSRARARGPRGALTRAPTTADERADAELPGAGRGGEVGGDRLGVGELDGVGEGRGDAGGDHDDQRPASSPPPAAAAAQDHQAARRPAAATRRRTAPRPTATSSAAAAR